MPTHTSLTDALRQVWSWSPTARSADANIVARANERAAEYLGFTESELRERTAQLRSRPVLESPPDTIAAVATFKESLRRLTGIVYYDVQLLAALAMTRSSIAEMATGEGKTYAGAMTSFLYGLAGQGVHVMTTNAYLAERDYQQVASVFQRLGMSVGLLKSDDHSAQKKAAYDCDVTYGPGYEFGFDYLRDQLTLLRQPQPKLGESFRRQSKGVTQLSRGLLQRGHAVSIVDEADSVFLDEANTPLLLSGPTTKENPHPTIYKLGLHVAVTMNPREDFVFVQSRIPRLTKDGAARAHAEFHKLADVTLQRPWTEYIEHALFALHRLRRDVHYIVEGESIKIVDDFTGRIFDDRTWRGGLHQMVEAKEDVTITAETTPLARISRQQFFQQYERVCGMTGTARGSEREFSQFYKLTVSAIPTRKPCLRRQFPGRYFATANDKWVAISNQVADIHRSRQPVLIGTRAIESSEELGQRLRDKDVPFQLLNGLQDSKEAAIIARAGLQGTVTVATNMAGRGTDIKLGPGVVELGGLHVIVAEPHDSRRVDRQLMGRAARQGDPGSCQCFAAGQDELIATHAAWLSQHMQAQADPLSGEVFEDLSKSIARIQKKVEQLDFAKRRGAFQHDAWLEDVMSQLAEDDAS